MNASGNLASIRELDAIETTGIVKGINDPFDLQIRFQMLGNSLIGGYYELAFYDAKMILEKLQAIIDAE